MPILVPQPWDRQPEPTAKVAGRFRASCVHALLGSASTAGSVLDVATGAPVAFTARSGGTFRRSAEVGVGRFGRYFATDANANNFLSTAGRISLGNELWRRTSATGQLTAVFVLDREAGFECGLLGTNIGSVLFGGTAQVQWISNTWYFDVNNETQRVIQADASSGPMTVVFSWDNTSKRKRLWRNGQLVFSDTADPDTLTGGTTRTYSVLAGGVRCYAAALFDTVFPDEQQLSLQPWQVFEPRRVLFPVAAAGGGASAALATTGDSGTFSGTANSTTTAQLAATGGAGTFSGSASSPAVAALATTGGAGAFSGTASTTATAALAVSGASGTFAGTANSTTTAALSATGGSGAFAGTAGAGTSVSLAALGGEGAFAGSAFPLTTAQVAALGSSGAFAGSASSSSAPSVEVAVAGASGIFSGVALQSAAALAAVGASGAFAGSAQGEASADETYPLAGVIQPYPLTASQIYPLAGVQQTYPLQ